MSPLSCNCAFATVHVHKTVIDYYIDMSAAAEGKIAGLKTPLLAVSALDDPIMSAAGSPIDDLEKIGDLYILLTRWDKACQPRGASQSWMGFVCFDCFELFLPQGGRTVTTPRGECGPYGNCTENVTPDFDVVWFLGL